MKSKLWLAVIGLFAMVLLILSGCQKDNETESPVEHDWTVHIVIETDTLYYVPGDSAVSRGFAIVTDQEDYLRRGVPVSITMSPVLGLIEWDNIALRDTTDYYGRVRFWFRSYTVSGNTVINACVGTVCDTWPLAIFEARSGSEVDSIALTLDKDTLWLLPYEEDSVLATLCLYDRFGNLIPFDSCGSFPFSGTGGRIKSFCAADTSGCLYRWWYPNHEFGEFWLWAGSAGFRDSACVFVGRR